MRRKTIDLLRSPETGNPLKLEVFTEEHGHIKDGCLIDADSGTWFRIEDGIAFLEPLSLRRAASYEAFSAKYRLGSIDQESVEQSDANALAQIAFFEHGHHDYERKVVESPFYRILDAVTLGRWLEKMLQPKGRILEVGCGSGRQTLMLLERGFDVVGIDLSEEMIRTASKKAGENGLAEHCDFIVAAAENLPLINSDFDAGIIYGSLHHFSDPATALREAGANVRAGGMFYLLEPHDSPLRFIFDWAMRLKPLWEEEAADEPLFNSQQFLSWLDAAGFDAEISYSTYLPPHLFYLTGNATGRFLLATTDRILGALPWVRRFAGVIVASGSKRI